jgi:hypothetical protein
VAAYYRLVARDYLGEGRLPEQLIKRGGFVNMAGNRYASDRRYEAKLRDLAAKARKHSRRAVEEMSGR